jgi:hypothetical protein
MLFAEVGSMKPQLIDGEVMTENQPMTTAN